MTAAGCVANGLCSNSELLCMLPGGVQVPSDANIIKSVLNEERAASMEVTVSPPCLAEDLAGDSFPKGGAATSARSAMFPKGRAATSARPAMFPKGRAATSARSAMSHTVPQLALVC
jgi:hypothetical protein